MKSILLLIVFANLAVAETSPTEDVEVGAPKDCVSLGKTNDQGEDVDQLALQKQVMDCLGPQEDIETVELKKKNEVVSQ